MLYFRLYKLPLKITLHTCIILFVSFRFNKSVFRLSIQLEIKI